jgi:hypothetical protein
MSASPAAQQRGPACGTHSRTITVLAARRSGHPSLHRFGIDVKQKMPCRIVAGMIILACLLLVACGTPPAKDFKGSWRPVNRFRAVPAEIPLHRHYTYFAAPIDETLKSMLTRWANDTERSLDYQLNYDVTLCQAVASLRTTDIDAAAGELNTVYAAQGVRVTVRPGEIVVTSRDRPASSLAPGGSGNDAKPKVATP